MNTINQNKGLEEETYKSVSELAKLRMFEHKALECQNVITSFLFVPQ